MRYLKIWPARQYAVEHPKPLLILGIRADESRHRATLPMFGPDTFDGIKRYRVPIYRPLLHWTEDDVLSFLQAHDMPLNPVYRYVQRTGCWCCPLSKASESALHFCQLHPELAQRWVDLEEEIGHTWKYKQSLADLLQQAQRQQLLSGL